MTVAALAAALGGWPATASADAPPLITTIAGGVGGPGPVSEIPSGGCVVTYSGGNLYTQSSTGAIRKVSLATGQLKTVVGTGYRGPVSDGQSGPSSNLEPTSCGIAVDQHGNVLFSDGEHIGPQGGLRGGNNLVRVVAAESGTFYGQSMIKGRLYTIAGDGSYGFSGDAGPARSAQLADPAGLAVDQAGNVVIADAGNDRIRVVAEKTGTFYGHAMKAGDIYTVAGDGVPWRGTRLGDGGPATKAALALNAFQHRFLPLTPAGASVRVDHQGNIVVADQGFGRVRVIPDRKGRFYGQAMRAGFIYTIAGGGAGKLGDGNLARDALLRVPSAVAIDHSGNVVIADQFDQRVRVVAVRSGKFYGQAMKAEHIYTVAGDGVDENSGNGGPATKAGLATPEGVSVDGAGNIVISGICGERLPGTSPSFDAFISPDCLRVVAERPGRFYARAMKHGDIYAISGVNGSHFGDDGPALKAEFDALPLFSPDGFAADQAGDLAIGDSGDARVRLVPATSGRFFGKAMTTGDIYTIAGNEKAGYTGDGGDGASAEISYPGGLAFDGAGNVLIADPVNFAVRVVAIRSGTFYGRAMVAGHIYTIAGDGTRGSSGNGGPATLATLSDPSGVAADASGNLLIGDGNAIRVIATSTGTFYGQAMTAGHIYDVADVAGVQSVGVDAIGNLIAAAKTDTYLIASTSGTFYGQAVTAGNTYLIAGGTFDVGTAASGVPATSTFVLPSGLALDPAGNLVFPDAEFKVIRVVARTSGTFFGIAMAAGDVYTIAGAGTGGLGDGGPASDASFTGVGVAALPSGAIDVQTPTRVRQISG